MLVLEFSLYLPSVCMSSFSFFLLGDTNWSFLGTRCGWLRFLCRGWSNFRQLKLGVLVEGELGLVKVEEEGTGLGFLFWVMRLML